MKETGTLVENAVSRRSFLKLAGSALASIALSGCGAYSPSASTSSSAVPRSSTALATRSVASGPAAGRKRILIRCGVPTSISHPFHKGYEYFGKKLAEATDGAVEWMSFPSGQLGSDPELTEGVKVGTIQMTVAGPDLSRFLPEWDVVSLPFLYDSYAHSFKVSEGDVGRFFQQKLEAAGFQLVGYYRGSTRNIITTNKALMSPEAIRGQRLQVSQSGQITAAFDLLGAATTPLSAGELYSALKQGAAVGAEIDPVSTIDMRLFEVSRYYNLTRHVIDGMGHPFVMNRSFFGGLPDDIQKLVTRIGMESTVIERTAFEELEERAQATLEEKGIEVVEVDAAPFAKLVRERLFPTIESKQRQDLLAKILSTKA